MAFDPSKNVEYDAEFAKIGKEEKVEEPDDEEQA